MREESAAQLRQHLGAVLSRRVGQALGLWGEAGVGKTFLARALLRELPCRSLEAQAAGVGAIAASLPRSPGLPVWIERGLERLTQGHPLEDQALVGTLAATLQALAPFVLLLEDLHEADPERTGLIVQLARAVPRLRGVGLLVTGRGKPPAPFRSYRLAPLERGEVTEVLEAQVGAALPREGLDWVFARTGGNPLFTLEFWRYLVRRGSFWSDGGRWHWRPPAAGAVPLTVQAVIATLVAGASTEPATRTVLEAGAILPHAADPVLWRRLAGLTPAEFDRAVSALEREGVLRGGTFAHPLIAEVTVQDLPEERRRDLARRSITLLEPTHPEVAVTLVEGAGLSRPEALALFRRALERSHRAADPRRRAGLLDQAALHAEGGERVQLALEAADLFRSLGSVAAAARLARLALDTEPDHLGARLQLVGALSWLGREEEVQALIAELPGSERDRPRWLETRFYALVQSTRTAEALALWRAHPELARSPENLAYAAHAHANVGDLGTAAALAAQALRQGDLDPRVRASLSSLLGFILSDQGHLDGAQPHLDVGLEIARQLGGPAGQAACHYNRAFNLSRLGRLPEAQRDLEDAIRLYHEAGSLQYAANAQTVLGVLLRRMGQFERAEGVMLEGYQALRPLGLTHSLVNSQWELAALYLEWQPSYGAALSRKFAREALEHARHLDNPRCLVAALPVGARVEAWQGDPALALALAREAFGYLDPHGSFEDAFGCDCALAAALEAGGRVGEALAAWDRARQRGLTEEYRNEAALEQARLTHDPARARELLTWFEACGWLALAGRARRYFPELREFLSPEGSPPSPAPYLRVLGPPRVERSGQPLPYRGRRRLELLCYLLEARLSGRGEVSLLELTEVFYPTATEAGARAALKQQVYLIRAALGKDSVRSTPRGYALGAVDSDAEAFLEGGGADLWRGAYLEGLGEGWLAAAREVLVRALGAELDRLMPQDPAQAARLGRCWLETEPYDLEGLRRTLRALRLQGHLRAARRVYTQARGRLLEVGETLPDCLEEFLGVPAAS